MKATPYLWIGKVPPNLERAAFKKYLPKQINAYFGVPLLVEFRFTEGYCLRHGNNLVCSDGTLAPVAIVHLPGGRSLIGLDDAYQIGLDYNDEARAFRAALDERERERGQSDLNGNS